MRHHGRAGSGVAHQAEFFLSLAVALRDSVPALGGEGELRGGGGQKEEEAEKGDRGSHFCLTY